MKVFSHQTANGIKTTQSTPKTNLPTNQTHHVTYSNLFLDKEANYKLEVLQHRPHISSTCSGTPTPPTHTHIMWHTALFFLTKKLIKTLGSSAQTTHITFMCRCTHTHTHTYTSCDILHSFSWCRSWTQTWGSPQQMPCPKWAGQSLGRTGLTPAAHCRPESWPQTPWWLSAAWGLAWSTLRQQTTQAVGPVVHPETADNTGCRTNGPPWDSRQHRL